VSWLLVSGQLLAAEPKQSVISTVQQIMVTAQGKQEDRRNNIWQNIIGSIQSLRQNTNKNNNVVAQQKLFASTQHNFSSSENNVWEILLDWSVFFSDIHTDTYEQSISVLASHKLFQQSEKFFPHNYVRLSDLSKVIINAYRISIWLMPIQVTSTDFVQMAFDEWFLVNVIQEVNNIHKEKIITYKDMQIILDNIQKQYPNNTKTIDISYPKNEILRKWAMSEYIVKMFNIQANTEYYTNIRFAHIEDSVYYDAMRTLLEKNIIDKATKHDENISRATFIKQLVRTYALDKKIIVRDMVHDIEDLNNSDKDSALIIYAYNQWRLDYILIRTKWQVFLEPEATITTDEVYEILAAIVNKNIVTGIIQAGSPISQGKIAQIIVEVFAIQIAPNPSSNPIQNPYTQSKSLVQRFRTMLQL
jgi:hypothetical protein